MASLRQQIITAIDTRLKSITVANGYETDLGNKVSEWHPTVYGDGDLDRLAYRDMNCEYSKTAYNEHAHALTIEIEAYAATGNTTLETVRKMIHDIIKAIGMDTQWSTLAEKTDLVASVIGIDQNAKIIGGCLVTIVIHYLTDTWEA